ncbi:MAG: metal-dependent transcriptional regulator [Oscillospiraceae bacterium]|nr:metal-dependent transcriptional regulator [Oscillospiraceae bacterium]
MALQESGEMYLETILRLSHKGGSVRSIDVCTDMGFSRPSVSRAVALLKSGGYLTVEDDGSLLLTDAGREIAEKIYERHTILSKYLTEIGVDPKVAVEDACRIEHVISDETFEAIKHHVEARR